MERHGAAVEDELTGTISSTPMVDERGCMGEGVRQRER